MGSYTRHRRKLERHQRWYKGSRRDHAILPCTARQWVRAQHAYTAMSSCSSSSTPPHIPATDRSGVLEVLSRISSIPHEQDNAWAYVTYFAVTAHRHYVSQTEDPWLD